MAQEAIQSKWTLAGLHSKAVPVLPVLLPGGMQHQLLIQVDIWTFSCASMSKLSSQTEPEHQVKASCAPSMLSTGATC
jgi:hypothetical protein